MHFRAIMFYCLLAAALSGMAAAQVNLPQSFLDHGTFKILSGSQLLGTEKFDIEQAGDGFRMKGELKVKMPSGPEAVESSVVNLSREMIVTSYTRIQKSPKKASVQ